MRVIDKQDKPIKVMLVLSCLYKKVEGDEILEGFFRSKLKNKIGAGDVIITDSVGMSEKYDKMIANIIEAVEVFQGNGSGWVFYKISFLDVHVNPHNPLSGSSYMKLPNALKGKRSIINVKNEDDDECFKWAVTSAVYPPKTHPQRLTKLMRENSERFNWSGIEFPMSLKDIDRFEKQNPFSINVLGYESGKGVYILRVGEHSSERTLINLILISNDETKHYCWVKNKSRLLSSQKSKYGHKRYFCDYCLNSFTLERELEKHVEWCSEHDAVKLVMPEEGSTIKFKDHSKKMRVTFVIYADFECFTENISQQRGGATTRYQEHTPSGFCFYIKCVDDSLSLGPFTVTKKSEDDDLAKMFVKVIEFYVKKIYNKNKFQKRMTFSREDETVFRDSRVCHICEETITSLDTKVRDHCHITGKFRGAAHNGCNLKYKVPKFYPVIFHNLARYDSHLFIRELGGDIKCIPSNDETYISFTKTIIVDTYENKEKKKITVKRGIRFIDSLKFMSSGLATLAKNLEKEKCVNLSKFYKGERLDLLLRKGVYPYDYMDGLDKLKETKLPPIEEFYSKLYKEDISEGDYEHAKNVWKTFRMKTMRRYHNLYLKTDVLLLSDIFENFRDVCLENYGLDPAWYFTSPGLAWSAALKSTKVELELLTDVDMLLMIERGIRGGVSMISTRHGKANNPYMEEEYDSSKPNKYITYLDANNLYGWAMSKPLPTHGFEWMESKDLKDWRSHPCILEVDLEYPKELHNPHNEYPLAPERIKIAKCEKLVPTLSSKKKYVVHHEALKTYVMLGLIVKKVHRGIRFEERTWLKSYIDLNTDLRSKAKNAFEKDFFKLMNNSVFGKTMENIRNRVDVKLVTNETRARNLISKPSFYYRKIFSENLTAFHMYRTKLVFDKPVYLGMSILDVNKTLMYDFHYGYIKEKFGEKAKLLFTDTDSLMYEIQTEDFYKDISSDVRTMFDTSNYPKDHPSGIETGINNKVIGMFKDEACGKQISEFVGLRAKLYSFITTGSNIEEKKCKGVKKATIANDITFQDYKDCLFDGEKQYRSMNLIRSHLHNVYTEEVNKVALSREDDKRHILPNGVDTLSIGHYKISL